MPETSVAGDGQSPRDAHELVAEYDEQAPDRAAPTRPGLLGDKRAMLKRAVAPVVLLSVLGCWIAFLVWFGWRAIVFPYSLDYGEGPVLDQAMRLAQGINIYQIPDSTPPWTVGNYTPLYPSMLAPLTLMFGPAYWYGRLVSLLSIAVSVYFAGSIVRQLTGDRLAATVTAMLLPTIPSIGLWAQLARVDSLALALSLGGLWCAIRWPNRPLCLVASIVLLAAAIYTKQTYALVAPLTAFTWLLSVSRRRALAFASALAAVVICAGVLLNIITKGGFWFNVITANINEFHWSIVAWNAAFAGIFLPVLVAAGVACVVIGIRRRDRAARFVSCYLLAAVVISITVGKVGSSVSYLMELGVALSLAAGAMLAWLRTRPWVRQGATAVLAIQALILLLLADGWYGYYLDRMDNPRADAQLVQIIRSSDEPVLADEEMGLLPLLGRSIEMQTFELTQLVHAGRWDQTPMLDAIRNQRYAVILIYDPLSGSQRWTNEMLAAIERFYVVNTRIARPVGETLVYRPRHRAGLSD